MKFSFAFSSLLALAATSVSAATFSETVDGTDAIYGAGLTGNGLSTDPVSVTFTAGTGLVLAFDSVTGLTNCCSATANTGPDGSGGNTSVAALNGISGISGTGQMFLIGVFVSSANLPMAGDTPPATLSFYGSDKTLASYSPLLNQAFFIGDGLTGTGSGTTQMFYVPDSADTLLLGFADSFSFSGTPSYYGDNTGSLSVSGAITGAAVPVPAALPLLGGALGGLALLRRRG